MTHKPKGFWTNGKGLDAIAAHHQGVISIKEIAEMEGVNEDSVRQAYWGYKRTLAGLPRSYPSGKRKPTERRPRLEGLVADFMKYAEDFAAAAIRETQIKLLQELDGKDRQIAAMKVSIQEMNGTILDLKAAMKGASEARTRDILKKAGVVGGE